MNSTAQTIHNIIKSNPYFDETKNVLRKAGYDLSYGNTYTIEDLKDSIMAGKRVIVSMNGRIELLVGLTEGDTCIIPFRPVMDVDNVEHYTDDEFHKLWDGSAIIIDGEQESINDNESKESDKSFIIHESQYDTWRPDEVSEAMEDICKIEDLGKCYLPAHPVLLCFKDQRDVKLPENMEAMDYNGFTDGIRITIISDENPIEYFLHELGHIYYDTRLMPSEKRKLTALWNDPIAKKHYSDIQLTGDAGKYKDPKVELFCDLYTWYLKGEIINQSYKDILRSRCHDGYYLINEIFKRIRVEERNKRLAEQEKRDITVQWMSQQDTFHKAYMNNGNPVINIKAPLFKSELSIGEKYIELPDSKIPDSFINHIAYIKGNRSVAQITDGKLTGKFIVLKADNTVDWEFHSKHKDIEKIVLKAIESDNAPKEEKKDDSEQQYIQEFIEIEKAGSELIQTEAEKEYEERLRQLSEIDAEYDRKNKDSIVYKAKKALTQIFT